MVDDNPCEHNVAPSTQHQLDQQLISRASAGDLPWAAKLLALGANPLAQSSLALREAAGNGHAECVRLLIPVSDPKAKGSYALQLAARNGHVGCVAMPSEKTKYPQLIKFARDNPLPTDALGLSLGILDVASLLVACLHREAARWDSMSLSLMHEARASAYPGSRLSNPAMLLNTRSSGPFGPSQGGHGPGCFFSYSHYQENSLGPALLLAAFSPRTMRPAISAAGYAQAIALLLSGGFLASARMYSGSSELSLDDFVNEAPGSENVPRASMSLEFHREHIVRLDRLRTDIGMRAALLALSDDKANLFGNDVREKLLALATRRSAESEASLIEASLSSPLLIPKASPPRI